MKPFNVISWDSNHKKVRQFDIMPYFVNEWNNELKRKHKLWLSGTKMPQTFEEFRLFIKNSAMCQFWSRYEYEILVNGFPSHNEPEKIDIYYQILSNLDIITKHFIENI